MAAATPEAPARTTAEKHDNCPKCGFKFPTPQTVCRNKSACERRQGETAKAGGEAPADPKADVKARIDDRAAARRQREEAAAAPATPAEPVAEPTADADKPAFKVDLRTDAQVTLVDQLFPGRNAGAGFRSGRAGKRLLVFADEIDGITAAFERAQEAAAEAETDEARRVAKTIQALFRNFEEARKTA